MRQTTLQSAMTSIRQKMPVKSMPWPVDALDMSTKNELIDVINSAHASGNDVKSIRPQKYAPNQVYMTLSQGGKQVGPVNVEGSSDELNRKFSEAQSYLTTLKTNSKAA